MTLRDSIRMYIAQQLILWALRVVPQDDPNTGYLHYAMGTWCKRVLDDMEEEQRGTNN